MSASISAATTNAPAVSRRGQQQQRLSSRNIREIRAPVSSRGQRGARVRVRAAEFEERDTDGPAIKVDLSLSDIRKGQKIGGGSFGDVFEGTYKGQDVVLKERKMTGPGKKFFDSEAALNRRLKNTAGVASFLGVAGANAFLVWKDEGRTTLDTVLNGGGGGGGLFGAGLAALGVGGGDSGGLAGAMGTGADEARAVKTFSSQLLQAVKAIHGSGVVHRDVKPDNILFANVEGSSGGPTIKLIDLGGAADLRVGTNYSPDETVFDPVYGPPERYLDVKGVGSPFGLGAAAGWIQSKPDLFDAFSCGMVILQISCPSLRKGKAMSAVKRDLDIYGFDAQAWRESLPERRQEDFEILDEDGGKGWNLVCGLLAQRKSRTSVASAIGHPFLR